MATQDGQPRRRKAVRRTAKGNTRATPRRTAEEAFSLGPATEKRLKQHEGRFGRRHASVMRREMVAGRTFSQAHQQALREA